MSKLNDYLSELEERYSYQDSEDGFYHGLSDAQFERILDAKQRAEDIKKEFQS